MYVRAKNSFNYGGIIVKNYGDHFEVEESLGQKLLKLDLVEVQNPKSFKKIKEKANDITIDKADNDNG